MANTPPDPSGSAYATNGFDFIHLTDSRGSGIWYFWLRISHGSWTTKTEVAFYSTILDFFWGIYLTVAALLIWIIQWVISFSWLSIIDAPVHSIGDAFQTMTDRVGGGPTFLVITALVTGIRMLRGRFADGFVDAATSFLIAVLALGALHNPVEKVVGPAGIIMQAHDWGIEVAAGLANGGDTTVNPAASQAEVTESMVDVFVRVPHQILNYGHLIDGTSCQQAYIDSTTEGKAQVMFYTGLLADNKVSDCDPAAKQVADNASYPSVVSSILLLPAVILLAIFALVFAGALIMGAAMAGFHSVKLILASVTGQLPGGAKTTFFKTIAELVVEFLLVVFALVFLAGYLLCIQATFTASTSDGSSMPMMVRFLLVDAVLLAGIVMFIIYRRRLKASSSRLAERLASRPGAAPARLPGRERMSPVTAIAALKGASIAAGMAASGVGVAGHIAGGGARLAGRGLGAAAGASANAARTAADRVSLLARFSNAFPARAPSPQGGAAGGWPRPALTAGTTSTGAAAIGPAPPTPGSGGGYRPVPVVSGPIAAVNRSALAEGDATLAKLGRGQIIDEQGAPIEMTLTRADTAPTTPTRPSPMAILPAAARPARALAGPPAALPPGPGR